jgi:branched-chain amino acid transport system substrate-binding protein
MSKVVIFTITSGNFEDGFPVTLRIREENGGVYREEVGEFPAAPDIPGLYDEFQQNYNNLDAVRQVINTSRGFDVDPDQTTNVSTPYQCRVAGKALEDRLLKWFEHPSIGQLRVYVEEETAKDESARVIFQTNDEILKKLPWHLWKLFEKRKRAWLSLGAKYNPPSKPLKTPVKILAILGNDDGIEVHTDGKILTSLPGSKVETLKQPTRQSLCKQLRDGGWDILCFAGHSSTLKEGNDGVIQINDIDNPSLRELKNAFIKAKENGLKLAIFNSCKGLGLASKLTELGIPQVIVMREPVPDEVAKLFLQEFLSLFSRGEKFHLAVRQAQEKLEDVENIYPYASWLPIICQNPAETSLHWRQPIRVKIKHGISRFWQSYKIASLLSLTLIGAASVILIKQSLKLPEKSQPIEALVSTPAPGGNSLDNLFSRGEKILLDRNPSKEKGILAVQKQDWNTAINEFRNSLRKNPNDPEALIYLNNAIAAGSRENNFYVAVSVPITKNSSVAKEILRGVAHAQSRVNCNSIGTILQVVNSNQTPICTGGINNKKLQIEIVDDGNNHQTTTEVARKIVNDKSKEDIVAVIGHYRSELTKAAVNQGYMNNILVISPTSTSTELSNLQYTVLRTVPSDSIAVENLNKYILNKISSQAIRPVIAYDRGESYSESIKEKFIQVTKQANIPIYDLKTDGAKQIINGAQKINANVLLLVASGTDDNINRALELVKEVSNLKNSNLLLLSASTLYNDETRTKFGIQAEQTQLVIAVPWQRSESSDNISKFEQESNQLWNGAKISWVTLTTYDAVQVIVKGLSTVPGQATRQSLKDNVLNNIDKFTTDGAINKIQFNAQQEKGSRKATTSNQELGVLVKVQCQNSSCDFVEEK